MPGVARGILECIHGCGAVFKCRIVWAEHNAVPHEQCPVCRGWFRDLALHPRERCAMRRKYCRRRKRKEVDRG